jgi:hypothetical protein
MVRSYWIGPLFGALAMTGLAQGQTPAPPVPAKASDSQERYVTVGDLGKPGQKCRVLKTWTMSNGHSAYQVQALDTGELITIEESDSAAKPTHIFHGARGAQTSPPGSPEPPANAVVLAQPTEVHSKPATTPLAAAAPEKTQSKWPAAFVIKKPGDAPAAPAEKRPTPSVKGSQPASSPAATPAVKVLQPLASPVAKTIELTPLQSKPAAPKSAPVASLPAVVNKSPYNPVVTDAPVVKTTEAKPANSTRWSSATTWKPAPPTQPSIKSPEPSIVKTPTVVKKVETSTPQPSDWRESWGKIPPPKSAPIHSEERVTIKAPPKVELPHAVVKEDDPLSTPEKFTALPDAGAFGDSHTKETKKPLAVLFASTQPPPAPKAEEKKPERPAVTVPPPPVPVEPVVAVKPAPAALPELKISPPTSAQPTPPATAKAPPPPAPAPVTAEVKAEAKPTVPLGMQSVLAVRSPELAPPAPQKPASPSQAQAMGIDANEANAFTEPPTGGKTAVASNGFWGFKKAAPAASPQPEAVAMRPTSPPGGYILPPLAPASIPSVTQAEFHQEISPELAKLSVLMHESLYPSQREWAAERLASFDWRRQPQAVELLIERAKQDAAPSVRVECIRSLGRMTSDAPGVVETVRLCRFDADPRVRQEADDALAKLNGKTPAWNGVEIPPSR